ncbi:MAG: GGDEF domain-containing protein [Lachnospiraceae bacterium]|nr:GGDEF domain-containing protein [Lachnospiraceae bacterium]
MKKFDQMKTLELFVFMFFAMVCFYKIVISSDIYQQITTDKNVMHLSIFLWLSLFLSFTCIFIDFSLYSKQNQNLASLAYAANTDSVARIANRYSIDSIIDEYAEKDIPKEMGAAMIELTSLKDVNANFGRVEGNNLIRSFSLILSMASLDECVVGRNGGNRFIILYEKSSDLHLAVFLDRLSDKVRDYNANTNNHLIKYEYGTAYAEADDITSITRLIALSSMRLSERLAGPAPAAKKEPALSEEELQAKEGSAPSKGMTLAEEEPTPSQAATLSQAAAPAEAAASEDDLENFLVEPLPMSMHLTEEDLILISAQKLQKLDRKRARTRLVQMRMAQSFYRQLVSFAGIKG